jgi:hypothetical protein
MVYGVQLAICEAKMPRQKTFMTDDFGVYGGMMNEKLLDCSVSRYIGATVDCKPGRNGGGFRLNGQYLTLPIGRKTPSVTGVSKVDQTSALADVLVNFEPSSGYDIFKRWQAGFSEWNTENERHTVHLRLYDDGWRVEKVD